MCLKLKNTRNVGREWSLDLFLYLEKREEVCSMFAVLNDLQKQMYFIQYPSPPDACTWAVIQIGLRCSITCSHPYQESLAEVEEKYKKAMVSNAQLDNDKANLIYQVDTLKDVIEEMEEQMSEMRRELEDKSKVKYHSIKEKF